MSTFESSSTVRLTRQAVNLRVGGFVIGSTTDAAGRYLLWRGRLPYLGLGWTREEASETLLQLAAERAAGVEGEGAGGNLLR